MTVSLRDEFQQRRGARPFYPSAIFTDDGIRWGADTQLSQTLCASPQAQSSGDIHERERALALAAVAAKSPRPDLIRHLEAASQHWRAGDPVQANLRLAFARLPRLDPHDAYRLFLADKALALGVSPGTLLKELGFPDAQRALLKYPGQDRVPAGSGRPSGEFSSGQQGDAAVTTGRSASTGARVTTAFLDTSEVEHRDKLTPPAVTPWTGDVVQPEPSPQEAIPKIPGGPSAPLAAKPPASAPSSTKDPKGSPDAGAGTGPSAGNSGGIKLPPWRGKFGPDDKPEICPDPVPDIGHGRTKGGDAFEEFGHGVINPDNPLKLGQAIFYHGYYYDDCARHDDPLGRWKAGDMIEFKGPSYAGFIGQSFWAGADGFMTQARNQNGGVEGTGRRSVWLFQEPGAVQRAQEAFKGLHNIDVFALPMPKRKMMGGSLFHRFWEFRNV